MTHLINPERPPAFCPGCSHDRVVHALDRALERLKLTGPQVAVVSDIGCSGLVDTFFNTHALHGLHGRALTYATGLKLACPELTVVVTMGDGGLGIGGAHLLSACRRNLDLTLLVHNNFNYGMTGGQCSATTPADIPTASGFLNQLERPMDVCRVAASAGAPYAARVSAFQKDLSTKIADAIGYNGFALVDIWGVCPGRQAKVLTPKQVAVQIAALSSFSGEVSANQRPEYGARYRQLAAGEPTAPAPLAVPATFQKPFSGRREVLLLGRAGQHVQTAGALLCLAAMTAGLHAVQSDDYPITVLRGHSVCDIILGDAPIGFSGIEHPDVVLALAAEGVARRAEILSQLGTRALVITAPGIELPATKASVITIDYRGNGLRSGDWALAGLAALASQQMILTTKMLHTAMGYRFSGPMLKAARAVVDQMIKGPEH